MHGCKCGNSVPVGAPFGVQCTIPGTSITQCLLLKQGQLQVLFRMTVPIEHIPKTLNRNGRHRSAPAVTDMTELQCPPLHHMNPETAHSPSNTANATSCTEVLHGESITDQASPRTPTQRTFQPQEAVQPQRNQTILQADTPMY